MKKIILTLAAGLALNGAALASESAESVAGDKEILFSVQRGVTATVAPAPRIDSRFTSRTGVQPSAVNTYDQAIAAATQDADRESTNN